jgi:uncharacterized protein (TIGR04255 family)
MMTEPVPNLDQLPRFNKPPVVEVAIGVEFLPIPSLTIVPLVELRPIWNDIYPCIEEQPAIRSIPPEGSPFPGFNFEIQKGVPPIRIWLLNENRSELLQIQNDRMVLNWRANFGSAYPHYRELEPRFLVNWHRFREAIADRTLGELQPIIAEVTYINRFTLEEGETLFDALSIFDPNAPLKNSEPSVELSVDLIASDGTTQFGKQKMSAARSQDEGKEAQLISVTRIDFRPADDRPIEMALRRAHAIAVNGFANVTAARMHKRWERIQ